MSQPRPWKRWTPEEDAIVTAAPTNAAAEAALTEAGYARTPSAVKQRRATLNRNNGDHDRRGRWKLGEISLLRQHYPTGGAEAVQAAGVKRTCAAIQSRAAQLGIADLRAKSMLGDAENGARGSTLLFLPGRPKRLADALAKLAETPGLTPTEYERRKAAILANH